MRGGVRHAIPTLGYPSLKAACVGLCFAGHTANQISALTGTSVNSVHRALSEHRRATGQPLPLNKEPKPKDVDWSDWPGGSIWDLDEDRRRQAIARRAALGAGRTLQRAGL